VPIRGASPPSPIRGAIEVDPLVSVI